MSAESEYPEVKSEPDVQKDEEFNPIFIELDDLAKLLAGFMTNPDFYDPKLVERVVQILREGY